MGRRVPQPYTLITPSSLRTSTGGEEVELPLSELGFRVVAHWVTTPCGSPPSPVGLAREAKFQQISLEQGE